MLGENSLVAGVYEGCARVYKRLRPYTSSVYLKQCARCLVFRNTDSVVNFFRTVPSSGHDFSGRLLCAAILYNILVQCCFINSYIYKSVNICCVYLHFSAHSCLHWSWCTLLWDCTDCTLLSRYLIFLTCNVFTPLVVCKTLEWHRYSGMSARYPVFQNCLCTFCLPFENLLIVG